MLSSRVESSLVKSRMQTNNKVLLVVVVGRLFDLPARLEERQKMTSFENFKLCSRFFRCGIDVNSKLYKLDRCEPRLVERRRRKLKRFAGNNGKLHHYFRVLRRLNSTRLGLWVSGCCKLKVKWLFVVFLLLSVNKLAGSKV